MKEESDNVQKHEKRGGNVVGAFILIFIGLLFLANNLGIVPWTVWADFWRFWPVILILIGIQFLLGKSTFAKIVMAIIVVATIALIFLYVLAGSGSFKGTKFESLDQSAVPTRQELRVAANDFQNVTQRRIAIDSGFGKFVLNDDESNDYFTLNTLFAGKGYKPEVTSKKNADMLDISVRVPGREGSPGMMMRGERFEYTGNIGQSTIPTDINMNVGAGEGTIQLESVKVRDFSLDVGAGATNVDLRKNSIPERINLDLGVGSITFSVPEEVGIMLTYDVGLGNLQIENQNFRGSGTFRTKNYEQANQKLQISAQVGTGSIAIRQNE